MPLAQRDPQLAAGLSLWRFFYRSASLFASKDGDGFAKLFGVATSNKRDGRDF